MSERLIKAAMVKSESNEDFIAFFDFYNLIRDNKGGQAFLMSMRLLTPVPIILAHRIDGQWRYLGSVENEKFVKRIQTLSDEEKQQLILSNPALMIPTKPTV